MAGARRSDDNLTDKQRIFVALRTQGIATVDAYIQAFRFGPVANLHTVSVAAHRLEKHSKIAVAISAGRANKVRLAAEIEKKVVAQASTAIAHEVILSRKFVLDTLVDNAMRARAAVPVLDSKGSPIGKYTANYSASNRALELLGKEIGLFREAKAPDLFESLSPEQVRALKKLLEDWRDADLKQDAERGS